MIIEKVRDDSMVDRVIFPDLGREMVDIDHLFMETNRNFSKLLIELGLLPDFDFRKPYIKRLYTHEFLRTFLEKVRDTEPGRVVHYYSNILTKDDFRNRLIKKLRSIFGFRVWEETRTFDQWAEAVENGHCGTVTALEMFFAMSPPKRGLKAVRGRLEREGLTHLSGPYFDDFSNKLLLHR